MCSVVAIGYIGYIALKKFLIECKGGLMNIEFDAKDIEQIAERVAMKLLPHLSSDFRKERKEENYLTVDEVADRVGRGKSWVYRKVQLGEIPYTKPGKYLHFDQDEIKAWMKNHSVRPSRRNN